MKSVKVAKNKILEILKKNREEHRELLEKAVAGYKIKVTEWLDARMTAVLAGKTPSMTCSLPEPSDHTDDYSTAITMIELSVDNTIELSEADFHHYIMNKWSWMEYTLSTNTSYSGIR